MKCVVDSRLIVKSQTNHQLVKVRQGPKYYYILSWDSFGLIPVGAGTGREGKQVICVRRHSRKTKVSI